MQSLINELTGYLQTIQEFDKDASQDAGALHSYLIELTQFGARSNFIMAEYKREFRKQKEAEYNKMAISSKANDKYYSPTLAKDYIDSQCHDIGYVFDLATRVSASVVHTIDAVRTICSSLKSERQFSNYQS